MSQNPHTGESSVPTSALVTGATGGIGRAICLALAAQARQQGRPLRIAAAASRPGVALDALLAELTAAGAQAVGLVADVTDPDACRRLIAEAEAACGDLDTLVSNAGASGPDRLAEMSVERWDRTFALNCRATWLLAQAARPGMARQRGSVVAIASMSGLHPHPGYGAYSSAKAALIMLCRQLAQEWAADGIRPTGRPPAGDHRRRR
jgi:glucose 1-dehydrogenase